jgi:hypothetical protein
MYSAKTVAFAILFGNCIGFFLWASVMALGSGSSENPTVETQETDSIFGVKSVVKVPYKGQEDKLKAGFAVIDYILGLWFIFSTGWALWVILNPIPS